MVVVGALVQTPYPVEGEGEVVQELDRTVTIAALYRDLARTVIPMDIRPLEAVVAMAGQETRPSMMAPRRSCCGLCPPPTTVGLFPN